MFMIKIFRNCNKRFYFQGNDAGDTAVLGTDLILPAHQVIHQELEPYTELLCLLRSLDNKAHILLTKVYTSTMSNLYKRELKYFFEEAKNKLISKRLQGE